MKTDNLISALVADNRSSSNLGRSLAIALFGGMVVAGVAFFTTLGARPDIDSAMKTSRFLFKFVVTLSLVAASLGVLWRIGRPGVPLAIPSWLLTVPIVVLIAAIVLELLNTPQSSWSGRLVGSNAYHCLTAIPLLSLPLMAGLLYAMRQGAPTHPALAGAAVGLASAGVAATFYALNCTDDSPLFVATWYTLAVFIIVAVSGLAGSRLLRW